MLHENYSTNHNSRNPVQFTVLKNLEGSGYCYDSRNPIPIFYCYGIVTAHARWHVSEHERASSVAKTRLKKRLFSY